MISGGDVVQHVPDREGGDADKETESSPQLRYEGDGGEGPDLPLHSDLSGGEFIEKQEVTGSKEISSSISI